MAIKDLFRNYIYGKPNKRDFTEADLPENRVQLFRHVLGNRMGKMVGMNLLMLLFWLPAIAWTALILLNVVSILALPEAELLTMFHQIMNTWLVILFPLIAIAGPFNVGASDVFRRWAQDEHCFPMITFRAALKANWKQGLLFGVVDGLVPLLAYLAARFYWELSVQSKVFLVPVVLALLLMLLWLLAAPLVPQLIVGYELRFVSVLKNALLMTLVSLPRSIAVRLVTLVVPLLGVAVMYIFPSGIGVLLFFGPLLYAAFLLSFNKLIWASYANALGEKFLNPRIPGAPTNIGLRPNRGE